jgi:hypothetical protein
MRYQCTTTPYSRELVVARYNEDIEWLDSYPFNKFPIVIYEKGSKHSTKHRTIKLPNVGRDYHSYLTYIITNYDNLPDVVLFLPGSVPLKEKYDKALRFANVALECREAVDALFHLPLAGNLLPSLYNFEIDYWKSRDANNAETTQDTIHRSAIRPFGKWFEHHFSIKNIPMVWYCGVLVATRERIRKIPLQTYINVHEELSQHSNSEVGHYMERAMAALFV